MDWNYEGEKGPENWGAICPAFKEAEDGSLQSPVPLKDTLATDKISKRMLSVSYTKTVFESSFFNHTVHLNPIAGEKVNSVFFNHKKYSLEDIHFHLPSEHEINDQSFPIEVHLVHRSQINELLVLGVMMLPNDKRPINLQMAKIDKKALNPSISRKGLHVPIDVERLLPDQQQFFHYTGSLTTPPTIGPVEWIVFKYPGYMRQGLLQAFQETIGKTNRPLQSVAGRKIYLSK